MIISTMMLQISKQLFRRMSTLTNKIVLGIETSCDETGAAVVDESGQLLGEGLESQMKIHLENGGVIPHIANYFHKENISRVVAVALTQSGLSYQDLSAIAVTTKPGLKGSLTVGVEYAKKLARTYEKGLIPIHHMEAHALTARMVEKVDFPFLVLLASGGHCQLAVVKSVEEFLLLGTSHHNSPGEILDKIARRLKLINLVECSEMSGGHAIDFMAQDGDPTRYNFPMSLLQYRDCNFAFSGYFSFSSTLIEEEEEKYDVPADGVIPTAKDFCASLLHGYAIHLMHRVHRAFIFCEQNNILNENQRSLVFSGGVACSSFLRRALKEMCEPLNIRFCCPPPKLCTDNGIMIAWNGIERLRSNVGLVWDTEKIEIDPDCSLGIDVSKSVREASIKLRVPKLKADENTETVRAGS